MERDRGNMTQSRLWQTLAIGCYFAIIGGHTYAFAVWSVPVQQMLEKCVSQPPTSATLFQAVVFGCYLPVAGVYYDAFGKDVVNYSTAIGSLGYLILLWLTLSPNCHGLEQSMILIITYIALFSVGLGSNLTDISYLACNLKNFGQIGCSYQVAALVKSYFGLSASFLLLFNLVGIKGSNYLLLLAVGTFTIAVLNRFSTEETVSMASDDIATKVLPNVDRILLFQFGIILLMFSINMLDIFFTLSTAIISFLTFLFCSSLFLFLRFISKTGKRAGLTLIETNPEVTLEERRFLTESAWSQTICSIEFHLLSIVMLIGMGGGLSLIGNGTAIMKMKNPDIQFKSLDIFISCISISNCCGRLLIVFIGNWLKVDSEYTDEEKELLKEQDTTHSKDIIDNLRIHLKLLLLSLCTMLTGFLLLFSDNYFVTLIAGCFVGLSYGFLWTISPSLMFMYFGRKYFAQNNSLMSLSPTLGYFVVSGITFNLFVTNNWNLSLFYALYLGLILAAIIMWALLWYRLTNNTLS